MAQNRLHSTIMKQISDSPLRGWLKSDTKRLSPVPCITFQQYMACCLYDEQDGYYRSGSVRVGKQGDFYTSPSVGTIMASVIAGYAARYSSLLGETVQLIEWGAGTGSLSRQIRAAGKLIMPDWDRQIEQLMVEDHPAHQLKAQHDWQETFSDGKPLILASVDAWQAIRPGGAALIIANELLDAFPVHRVEQIEDELLELGVAADEVAEGFQEVYMPLSDSRIAESLSRDGIMLKRGAQTEVNLAAGTWLKQLAAAVSRGRAVLIDYGHDAAEYTAEHRSLGTLLCYYKHQASTNPYVRAGMQDITAHVPFSIVRHSAEEAGWRVISYTTQNQFLIDNGVLELLQSHEGRDPFSEAARVNRAVRQLLLSDGMGESFKVMILEKG